MDGVWEGEAGGDLQDHVAGQYLARGTDGEEGLLTWMRKNGRNK